MSKNDRSRTRIGECTRCESKQNQKNWIEMRGAHVFIVSFTAVFTDAYRHLPLTLTEK